MAIIEYYVILLKTIIINWILGQYNTWLYIIDIRKSWFRMPAYIQVGINIIVEGLATFNHRLFVEHI